MAIPGAELELELDTIGATYSDCTGTPRTKQQTIQTLNLDEGHVLPWRSMGLHQPIVSSLCVSCTLAQLAQKVKFVEVLVSHVVVIARSCRQGVCSRSTSTRARVRRYAVSSVVIILNE